MDQTLFDSQYDLQIHFKRGEYVIGENYKIDQ